MKIGITLAVNGNDEGFEFPTVEAAALHAAEWIRGIDPKANAGDDLRIYVHIEEETADAA